MINHIFVAKTFSKRAIFTVLIALGTIISYAQSPCGTLNGFYLQQSTPSDPYNLQPVAVKSIYGSPTPDYWEGQFRWYVNDALVKTETVGLDYGWYSEYGPVNPGASVSVEFFDTMNNCVTSRQTFTAPGGTVVLPEVTQDYAIICDWYARIQLHSSMPNTNFVLAMFIDGTYQERNWSSSGYFELSDFNWADADRYYVKGSANGLSSSYARVQFFDSRPTGGATRSVNTNLTTNTVSSNTFGATQLQGQDGSVDLWEYSFSSAAGPYTNWGQAGLTTTSNTCCIGSPGQTIWIRAIVKKGGCDAVPSTATSYQWPIIPIVVNAGPDKSTKGGAVTFAGSATGGNDGIVSYVWTQTYGPSILPNGAVSGSSLTITPPDATADYVFRLTATDAHGQQGFDDVMLAVVSCLSVNLNFRLEDIGESGNPYNPQPTAVRATYGPTIPNYFEGEFRWYVNDELAKKQIVGLDYGWYSEYGPVNPGASVSVKYYDALTGCESSPQTFTAPDPLPPPPSVWQEYAKMCGDNIGRVQMRSSSPNVTFELRKSVEGGYTSYGANNDGYLEDRDFNPAEANNYYVISFFQGFEIGTTHVIFYVQLNNDPPDITGITSICEGEGTTLTASGGGTGIYKWYNADGTSASDNNTLVIPAIPTAGTYNYSAEAVSAQPLGCVSARRQTAVTVSPKPVNGTINASSTSIRLGETVQITSASGVGEPTYRGSSTGGASWDVFSDAYAGQYSFSFQPSTVGKYRIQLRNRTSCGFCTDPNNNCPSNPYVDITVNPDYNYIKEFIAQVEGVSESNVTTLSADKKSLTTTFFDGLGRPMQVVNWQGSPLHQDHLQPIKYDALGREARKYLPYVSDETNGWYKVNALSNAQTTVGDDETLYRTGEQYKFYQTANAVARDQNPYAETVFEPSPLSRVVKQGLPGAAWQPDADLNVDTDKVIKHSYQTNTDSEVLRFMYDSNTGLVIGKVNNNISYYAVNQLYANKTRDEHNNEVIEYVDKEGRTVCKKVQYGIDASSNKLYASTCYIYDEFGRLVVVLPPEGVLAILKTN